jgi:hypothetical protein
MKIKTTFDNFLHFDDDTVIDLKKVVAVTKHQYVFTVTMMGNFEFDIMCDEDSITFEQFIDIWKKYGK